MYKNNIFFRVIKKVIRFLKGLKLFSVILYLKFRYFIHGIIPVRDYLYKCSSMFMTKEILKSFGATIGNKKVRIGPYIYIHNAEVKNDFSNLIIGNDVYLGPNVMLDLWGKIIFKNYNGVGMNSKIFTHSNFVGAYSKLFPTKVGDVVFEEHAGINPGVTVLAGVSIGKNSYATPDSVVTKNVDDYVIVTGNPAKKVCDLPVSVLKKYQKQYIQENNF
jgi:maltose O-acetyltransferase